MRVLLQIFRNFSRTERWIFIAACLIFATSSIFIAVNSLYQSTNLVPIAGGEYIEGLVSQPTFINPVLAGSNGSDRDLIELVFSDLLDLAENYKVDEPRNSTELSLRGENNRTWNIRLKENLLWDDGQPITSDDVIFTIKTIQDSDSRSPLFSMWQEVKSERVSEREIKLILPETYAFFEATLKELKIIPKHIFGSVPAANFRLSDFNLEPIGSGHFKFLSFSKERSGFISEYQLIRNEYYSGQKPYLEKIVFKFYQDEEELIKAFNSGAINGFGGLNQKNLGKININHQTFEIIMPRYYAIFFNSYSQDVLKDKNVRLALDYATDRKKIIEKVFDNRALSVEGPLVVSMKGYAAEIYPKENFSLEKAGQILEAGGWQLNPIRNDVSNGVNSEGIREKNFDKQVKRLEFDLTVPEIPFLVETANLIKEDWSKIGVKLNLAVRSPQEVNDEIIKTRNYQMLIFGNIFGNGDSPDLYSFWHSSERFYPGLNLALYENKTADTLIQSIRKTLNDSKRQADLSSLQSIIIQDYPAVFLFSPHYLYVSKNWLKGFDKRFIPSSSSRFQNVEKWYIKTARVFR
jgi:peptide/nickel transport system substrate-binding protein